VYTVLLERWSHQGGQARKNDQVIKFPRVFKLREPDLQAVIGTKRYCGYFYLHRVRESVELHQVACPMGDNAVPCTT
jgi:hypothetical protein